MAPRISFVIPAYNEEKTLGSCLVSIERQISQVKESVEIIVVNNASTDRTRQIALGFPWVRVIDEERKGLVFARRAGFLTSKGELVANIDADTMLSRNWLQTVLREFEKRPNMVALSGPFIYHDLSWYHRALTRAFYGVGYVVYLVNHYVLKVSGMLQGGNFIVRRSALEAIGGFDTSIAFYGEDSDLARRLKKMGEVRFTFKLPIYASGRRLAKEGMVQTGYRYAVNFFSTVFLKRPVTTEYTDIRL